MLEGPSRESGASVTSSDSVDQAGQGRVLRGVGREKVEADNRVSYAE